LLDKYKLPKLFRLSWLAFKFKGLSDLDWRDSIEGFVNYYIAKRKFDFVDHECLFYRRGRDTYENCSDFFKKPWEEIKMLLSPHADLQKWLLPFMIQMSYVKVGLPITQHPALEKVLVDEIIKYRDPKMVQIVLGKYELLNYDHVKQQATYIMKD